MQEHIVPYNSKLKKRARELRNKMTLGEIVLWKYLKGKQMMGYDFDRQKPIDQFIVDFWCEPLSLAIEIDGPIHDSEDACQYDQERQARLEGLGVRFLRFRDDDVRKNTNTVCQKIARWIRNNRTPSSTDLEQDNVSSR